MNKQADVYLPKEVRVVKRVQESKDVFSLHLEFTDRKQAINYRVLPGQFNMLYAYGISEVPISVVSDIDHPGPMVHSIRALGSATNVLAELQEGDCLGLRGPFGNAWPLDKLQDKDVVVITGGIGSAPVITAINEIIKQRDLYSRLMILHGISQYEDLIYQTQYRAWSQAIDTDIYFSCNEAVGDESWHHGLVTDLLEKINLTDPNSTACIMCGPGPMMNAAAKKLIKMQVPAEMIFLSLERNMQCGLGHCGHCQCGPKFVCKDGPVFSWGEISPYIKVGL